ncbi:hypothetical protein [Streptomyces sp. CC208A]|uniref:hypothetical protein n=1 Tax=Streptomyces sp. CC208A TaxID=3044573 RepID=UPI0024A7FA2F|nr:hypothetical protein [Streptomyces sp. CC208A]
MPEPRTPFHDQPFPELPGRPLQAVAGADGRWIAAGASIWSAGWIPAHSNRPAAPWIRTTSACTTCPGPPSSSTTGADPPPKPSA